MPDIIGADEHDHTHSSSELEQKNKVIDHLTKTLAHTRECLEIARKALETINTLSAESLKKI